MKTVLVNNTIVILSNGIILAQVKLNNKEPIKRQVRRALMVANNNKIKLKVAV